MTFQLIYSASKRQYYWRLVAGNNRIICWSEYYHNRGDAIASINLVRQYSPSAGFAEMTVS